jgi:hypothetical protein
VPQSVAPNLVGWIDKSRTSDCHWKKQPETIGELQRAFLIFDRQELGGHRYRGSDPAIRSRVRLENCDIDGVPATTLGWGRTAFSAGFWKRITKRR